MSGCCTKGLYGEQISSAGSAVTFDVLGYGDASLVARRKALYEGYGFAPLPSNPLRLFLPLGVVRGVIEG